MQQLDVRSDAVTIDLAGTTGNAEPEGKVSGMQLHRAVVKIKSFANTSFRTV